MPYDNEYNKKLARETDYNNRKYIAHCDTTGQGTINYRVNIGRNTVGYGGDSGCGEATFSKGDSSESESESDEEPETGEGGQGILGIQSGTLLGGPKPPRVSRRAYSSFSSLGASLTLNRNRELPVNVGALASGTSRAGLPQQPQAGAPAAAPAAAAPPPPPPEAAAPPPAAVIVIVPLPNVESTPELEAFDPEFG
jgi:hypothetical protein